MSPTRASRRSSIPDRGDLVRVLEGEVVVAPVPRPRPGSLRPRSGGEGQGQEVGVDLQLGPGRDRARRRPPAASRRPRSWCQKSRSSTRWTKRALDRPDRRLLGQVVDGVEPEGQGAVAEGGDLGRGEGPGGFEGHGYRLRRGCAIDGFRRPKRPDDRRGHGARLLEGPEVAHAGDDLDPGVRATGRRRPRGGAAPKASVSLAAAQGRPGSATSGRWAKAPWEAPWA